MTYFFKNNGAQLIGIKLKVKKKVLRNFNEETVSLFEDTLISKFMMHHFCLFEASCADIDMIYLFKTSFINYVFVKYSLKLASKSFTGLCSILSVFSFKITQPFYFCLFVKENNNVR